MMKKNIEYYFWKVLAVLSDTTLRVIPFVFFAGLYLMFWEKEGLLKGLLNLGLALFVVVAVVRRVMDYKNDESLMNCLKESFQEYFDHKMDKALEKMNKT